MGNGRLTSRYSLFLAPYLVLDGSLLAILKGLHSVSGVCTKVIHVQDLHCTLPSIVSLWLQDHYYLGCSLHIKIIFYFYFFFSFWPHPEVLIITIVSELWRYSGTIWNVQDLTGSAACNINTYQLYHHSGPTHENSLVSHFMHLYRISGHINTL